MREIVGIVGNVREGGLDDDLWPAEYQAMYYGPDNFVAIAVRTAGDEKAILPVLIKTLHDIDPNLGTYGEITMTEQIRSTQSAHPPSLLHLAGRRLRVHRAGAGSGRALWRDRIFCQPANPRDRRAHGSRRTTQHGLQDGDAPGRLAHPGGDQHRPCVCRRRIDG